jgi:SAM-dependent methyltransferase
MAPAIREAIAVIDGEVPGHVGLYDELAPVYDFVLGQRYDHDAVATFVEARSRADATAVGVVGCGPGHLLERLATNYPTAVGLDRRRSMLELAANRTDDSVVVADPRTTVAPAAFDVLTLLGDTLRGLEEPEELGMVLERAHDSLRPGGVFVCDFIRSTELIDGHVTEDAFESDRYRVERTVVTDRDASDRTGATGRFTYAFTVLDRDRGRTDRVGTATPVRAYRPDAVRNAAAGAGLAEATLVDPPTPHGGGLVARRPE